MGKLRGVARQAAKKMSHGTDHSTSKRNFEAERLTVIEWMKEMVEYDQQEVERIAAVANREREKQQRIADARALRLTDRQGKFSKRMNRKIVRQKKSTLVPSCFIPDGVRIRGNKNGCGAAYRIVNGEPQRIE